MTCPAATVWPMSRMAKRPICGKALKDSITMGFVGRIFTIAASPVLMKSGFSAFVAPVFGSRLLWISSNVQATWAVCAWKTGVYPAVITDGGFTTMICAVKDFATVGGVSAGPATSPRRMSFFSTPRTLNPTLSPGSAWGICSWCISMLLISPILSEGMKWTFMPTFRTPVSIRPTGTVPAPVIEYTSWMGSRRGLSVGFGGTWSSLKAATRVGPLYQPIFVDGFAMLSPLYALMGMKGILSTLYPTDFRRVETSDLMSLNRASLDRKSVV